jgi:hypothetical protein
VDSLAAETVTKLHQHVSNTAVVLEALGVLGDQFLGFFQQLFGVLGDHHGLHVPEAE